MDIALKPCFTHPVLNVMNFLNEVVLHYPQAISFAPGRPAEQFFNVERYLEAIGHYVDHRTATTGLSRDAVVNDLGQYSKTNGIIKDLIARELELDEKIRVPADSIVVTCGCQEAMMVLLGGLFEAGQDVLIAADPTYIGITGLADILGIQVLPVSSGENGVSPATLEQAITAVRRRGLRPRAFYDVPDFSNPMGTSMPLEARHQVLELATRHEMLVFEDNPYGMFAYDGAPQPTLKSLDREGVVVYLGTFSKTLCPGLRMGFLVADQTVTAADGSQTLLAVELSKVKSLTTVNTPPLLQALVGGVLLDHGGSLQPLMADKIEFYRRNRDCMLEALGRHLGDLPGVRWNRPAGGFFLTVFLPFDFDDACLRRCAADYGVICCPMSHFSLTSGRERQIRLSFSYVTPQTIELGIERLSRFVRDQLAAGAAAAPNATVAQVSA